MQIMLVCSVVWSAYIALGVGDVADVVGLVVRDWEEAAWIVIHAGTCIEPAANDFWRIRTW